MILPAAAVSLLLAMLVEDKQVFSRRTFQHARGQGWVPQPGDSLELRVPRRWFNTHPDLVPPPFAWPSSRAVGAAEHPWRTVHILLTPQNFIELTNTPPDQISEKAERMRRLYLPIAQAMLEGREVPNFPPPWLQIGHEKDAIGETHPYVRGHEGRHRATMAIELGLPVMPVILMIPRGPEGWEHQRWKGKETIDEDPVVQKVTAGKPVWIYNQDHGAYAAPRRYMKLRPMAITGQPLDYEMNRLKLTLDPSLRYK